MSRLVQGGLLVVMLATVGVSAIVMSFFAWASIGIALSPDGVSADVKSVASAVAAVVVVGLVLAWTKTAPVTRGDALAASRHV